MKNIYLSLFLFLGIIFALSPSVFADSPTTADEFYQAKELEYSGQDYIELNVDNGGYTMYFFLTFQMPPGVDKPFGFLKINTSKIGIIGSDLLSISSANNVVKSTFYINSTGPKIDNSSFFPSRVSTSDYWSVPPSYTLTKSTLHMYEKDDSNNLISIGGGLNYPNDGVNIARFWNNEFLDNFNVSPNTTSVYGISPSINIPKFFGLGKFIEYSIDVNGKTYKTGHLADLLNLDLRDYVVGERIIIPFDSLLHFGVKIPVGTVPSKVLFTVQEYSILDVVTSYIPFWNSTPVYTATDSLFVNPTLDGDIQAIIDNPVVDDDNNKLGFDSDVPVSDDYDDSILGSIHFGFDKLLYYVEQPFKLIASSVSSLIKSISSSFNWISTFNGFLANIFSFLPSEFLALIYVVVAAFALGIVLHIFLGR